MFRKKFLTIAGRVKVASVKESPCAKFVAVAKVRDVYGILKLLICFGVLRMRLVARLGNRATLTKN